MPSAAPAPAADAAHRARAEPDRLRTASGRRRARAAAGHSGDTSRSSCIPERIADEGVQARLAGMTTLTLSTSELLERYQQPALQARRQRQQAAANSLRSAPERPMRDPNMAAAEPAAGRVVGAEAAARDLQRAAARGSAHRLLVQPLQRRRAQGPGAVHAHRVRARGDPAARARAASAICSARPRRARRCSSISTTG